VGQAEQLNYAKKNVREMRKDAHRNPPGPKKSIRGDGGYRRPAAGVLIKKKPSIDNDRGDEGGGGGEGRRERASQARSME